MSEGPYRIRLKPSSGGVWEVFSSRGLAWEYFSSRGVVDSGKSLKRIRRVADTLNLAHHHALTAQAERVRQLEEALGNALAAVQWMSAASDFDEGGKAHVGWCKVRADLDRWADALTPPAKGNT